MDCVSSYLSSFVFGGLLYILLFMLFVAMILSVFWIVYLDKYCQNLEK